MQIPNELRRTRGALGLLVALTAALPLSCSVSPERASSLTAAEHSAAEFPAAEPAGPAQPAAGEQLIFDRDWVCVELPGYNLPLPSPPPIAGFIITREGGGRVTGTTACNRMSAGVDLDTAAGTLRFTKLRNTRMMCDRIAADTEEAVLEAMIATDAFRIRDGRLELWSKGVLVARLAVP